jgi:16S rRNA (guanine(527)-N(7))-methyltransferase RsmG
MNLLQKEAAGCGVLLTSGMCDSFSVYTDMLLEWNKRINLTAITGRQEMVYKHYIDSLLVLAAHDIPQGARFIDIGSGAGFPGIPVKIARPDLRLTLLDSQMKRALFLETLSGTLGQNNTVLHGRAEELAHNPDYREKYDICAARAVADLSRLVEICFGFVKPGGFFLAMKAALARDELESAAGAINKMGGGLYSIKDYNHPQIGARSIIIIRKISQTPTTLPRTHKKMTKTPL